MFTIRNVLFRSKGLQSTRWTSAIGCQLRAGEDDFVNPDLKVAELQKPKKPSLVIFDKDGTLICFHAMWTPWALNTAKKLEVASGLGRLNIANEIYRLLGYNPATKRVDPGLLAESTMPKIRGKLVELLVHHEMPAHEAAEVVNAVWEECDTSSADTLKSLHNLRHLFTELKKHDIKIAVCTADSRDGTVKALNSLGIADCVDVVVCGDDDGTKPKPDPHNAFQICKALGVDPKDTMMVGDTMADMGFGQSAELGGTIGVLSGVSSAADLQPHAHHIVDHVGQLLPLIFDKGLWASDARQTRLGSLKTKPELIIFDKTGTLICFHSMWTPWVRETAKKLADASGFNSRDIENEIFHVLGFNAVLNRVHPGPGLLAEGTLHAIRSKLLEILIGHGMDISYAEEVLQSVWLEGDPIAENNLKSLYNLFDLFSELRGLNIKIAVITSDSRSRTVRALQMLGVDHLVDKMACGDDSGFKPKPDPGHALSICAELGVDPSKTLVVGDTVSDMMLAKKFGASVAVLSGAGSLEHLKPHADRVIDTVEHLIPLIMNIEAGLPPIYEDMTNQSTEPAKTTSTASPAAIDLQSQPRRKLSTWASSVSWNRRRLKEPGSLFRDRIQSRTYATLSEGVRPTHVIVGAGSAGCVLANRLTENKDNRVLLIEAGPRDEWWNWKIHMPAALMYNLCNDKYNWYYHTLPQKHCNNRVMYWPRGRVWGGSSALNAMAYVRGHPLDYDRWGKQGAEGWSYAACLPYFKKSQTHENGEDEYSGGSGPLHVSRGKCENPLHQAWMKAGVEAGYGYTEDMNGFRQEGVGPMFMTCYRGKRWSASQAYLQPILKTRSNLFTMNNTLVSKLLFDGNRAVGLEYTQKGKNHVQKVLVERDVILSGGSINSPQLLMLSGVGPADHLRSVGVPVFHNLPGVGSNLQDHLEVYVQQRCTKPVTLYNKSSWKFPHTMIRIGLQWFLTQTGEGASSHMESGGFVRRNNSVPHPDVQFHFVPTTVHDHGRKGGDGHGYQVHVGPMRPTSTGTLRLATPDPREHPLIDANYLATESDRGELRDCIRISRDIFAQSAFDQYRGEELAPGLAAQSDKDLDAYIREKSDSAYHPSCTCKMGPKSDPMAVVDGKTMKVWGLEGLRIVDASVMPSIVSGNLNGPTIMLAERASDLIQSRTPLPELRVPIWQPQLDAREPEPVEDGVEIRAVG